MIQHPAFPVEPWALREADLDLERLAQTESVFALANGHIGLRGNLDEGEPHGLLGTYLAGFYEIRRLPYAEAGYGYPEAGQTVVNATDGSIGEKALSADIFKSPRYFWIPIVQREPAANVWPQPSTTTSGSTM